MKAYSNTRGYKLAQLCRATNFHPSTVHYYVKIGLLHKPRKVGLGLYLYDDIHLRKLDKIRALREKENLSLSKIKEMLKGDSESSHPGNPVVKGEKRQIDAYDVSEFQSTEQVKITRKTILDLATGLFSRKGYEGTTISDITQALNMSKGSFYLYFRDKRELFIHCIERLAYWVVPEETRGEISRETDYLARQAKRTIAFLEAFPFCAGILNVVKMASMAEDPSLASSAREAFANIMRPIVRDFRRAVAQGMVREVDEEFLACVVLGMAETVGYKLMTDTHCDLQECVERYMDIIARGLLPRAGTPPEATACRSRSGRLTDVKGETVKVGEISFGGKPYLAGRVGEGEIRVDTDRVAFMLLNHTGEDCTVKIAMTDGEKTRLELDGNMIVSAASSVGLYTVPMRRVRSISFA